MGNQRKKNRIRCKIDNLPPEIKERVDLMLADTKYTYMEIAMALAEDGYEISKSAVGRYALRTNGAAQRLIEAQEQTKALINVMKNNPDTDYTEASMQLLMDGLTKKLAAAQEEFDEMPLDKAGRLIASLSRTKVYKDRVKQDMRKKLDLAFEKLESDMLKAIRNDEELAPQMINVLKKAKDRMMQDDD